MSEEQALPKAIYGSEETPIDINGILIDCYVLDNKQRVLSQRGMLKALGMSGGGGAKEGADRLASFANGNRVKEFINNDLLLLIQNPIKFITKNGFVALGYEAKVLQSVVKGVTKAYLQGRLLKQQEHIGQRAELLDDAFSEIGLTALIDEATGYQSDINRAKDELQQLLSKLLLTDQAKWIKTFPDEFFEMIFKMKHWDWTKAAKKPQVIGHYINDFVYSRIAPILLDELRKKNPVIPDTGSRKSKHHQWLTPDFGHPKLKEHLSGVMALGRASGYDWLVFLNLLDRSYPKFGQTIKMFFPNEDVLLKPKIDKDTLFEKANFGQILGAVTKAGKPKQ